ncbi:MAG: 50S ribosomal protein L30 [bacterium]
MKNLKIKLIKSRIGIIPKHKKTLDALGLRKMGKVVVKPDNPAIQGMIRHVSYCLNVEELNA